ncbi:MAG: hypothetical protein NC206_08795 [Bacteroides sp.]|nr:hypothetical protein [Roseburia sp.]MCM1347168.1 hypothetical protein [Bacteroides sp.]MCM1421160.1 hypothetical protein [Bacteroides sp.]
MRILGIARASEFSPNMVDNDAAILHAVADCLSAMGHSVSCVSETDFSKECEAELIFSMARHSSTIKKLREMECETGVRVINSAIGVENCTRSRFTEIFMRECISSPQSWIFEPCAVPCLEYPCWIKRGDGCAQQKSDVSYVRNEEEVSAVMDDFKERGISCVVANKHLEGDLIKFYGVEGTDFFDWGYAADGHSKFGLETHNGKAHGFPFSPEELKCISDRAARVLDVPVYGGDCVVSETGELRIIDFNDWPSFSRCRDKAAAAIAERIVRM